MFVNGFDTEKSKESPEAQSFDVVFYLVVFWSIKPNFVIGLILLCFC